MSNARILTFLIATALLALHGDSEPIITVRFPQGSIHGFLILKTLEGTRLATGDITQVVHGDRVTAHIIFRFRDGSIDDDTTVFTQRRTISLVSDHHIQRGPSFPKPLNLLIELQSGLVTYRDEKGNLAKEHFDLPPDTSNGLPPNLLLNFSPSKPETKLHFVAPTAKPRLIQMSIKPAGEVAFTIGGTRRKAVDYVLHVELGGITGLIAPLLGKQPPDYHIWILSGDAPAFIREEGPLYEGGPIWRIEQISPEFSR